MGAELAGVEPDAVDPIGNETSVPPCRHAPARHTAAAEQEFARLPACSTDVIVDRLPGLLGHLESNRLARLLLADRCSIDRISVRGNVLNFESYNIATAQLAVDG